jgi:nucleotide-binding universal stress UspA family protein
MSKPIVVGVDVRRDDHEPLAFAAALARATGAPLLVVGAYMADPSPAYLVEPDHARRAHEETEQRLARLIAGLVGVKAHPRPTSQSPARALHEVAEAESAGLIVVGSTPRGVLGRIAAGRITERTVHGAPCAVAVVPRGYAPPHDGVRRVGAAFTDSPEGREALRAAAALARHGGGQLRALTFVEPIFWDSSAVEPTPVAERHLAERREAARRVLQVALGELEGVEATGEVLADVTVLGLVEASAELDVLVCGSRGYGRLRTVLVGGVSQALVREARCPVVVVPRGAERALEELVTAPQEATA